MSTEEKSWLTPRPRNRPAWDLTMMEMAAVIAKRGSCQRKQVGAVIVRDQDKHIMSVGYNGAPRNMPDCFEVGCDVRVVDGRESCVRTIHAESNALDFAQLLPGISYTLYCNVIPCKLCALRIIQLGINTVVYNEYYESQGTKEVLALFAAQDPDSRKLPNYAIRSMQPRVRVRRVELT